MEGDEDENGNEKEGQEQEEDEDEDEDDDANAGGENARKRKRKAHIPKRKHWTETWVAFHWECVGENARGRLRLDGQKELDESRVQIADELSKQDRAKVLKKIFSSTFKPNTTSAIDTLNPRCKIHKERVKAVSANTIARREERKAWKKQQRKLKGTGGMDPDASKSNRLFSLLFGIEEMFYVGIARARANQALREQAAAEQEEGNQASASSSKKRKASVDFDRDDFIPAQRESKVSKKPKVATDGDEEEEEEDENAGEQASPPKNADDVGKNNESQVEDEPDVPSPGGNLNPNTPSSRTPSPTFRGSLSKNK